MPDMIEFIFGGFFGAALIEVVKSKSLRLRTKIFLFVGIAVIGASLFWFFGEGQTNEIPPPEVPKVEELSGAWELGVFAIGKGNDVISCSRQRIKIDNGKINGTTTCTFGYNIYGPKTELVFRGVIGNVRYEKELYTLAADIEIYINDKLSAKGLARLTSEDYKIRRISYSGSVVYDGYNQNGIDLKKIDEL